MSNSNYSHDNMGNRCGEGAKALYPVLASGLTTSMAVAGTDYTETVVGGKTYAVTMTVGLGMFSATGETSTAANREWICPKDDTIIISVPLGVTTIYCESDTADSFAYWRELDN